MKRSIYFQLLGISLVIAIFTSCDTPKQNTKIEKILKSMTLEEKIDFIGGNKFSIRGNDSLGIPQINMADDSVGVRNFSWFFID